MYGGTLRNRRRVFIWYEVLTRLKVVITCILTVPVQSCNTYLASVVTDSQVSHFYCSVRQIILVQNRALESPPASAVVTAVTAAATTLQHQESIHLVAPCTFIT